MSQASLPADDLKDTVCLIEFDRSRYSSTDYAAAQIERPEQIVRSVAKRQAEFLAGRIAARARLQSMQIYTPQVGIGSARQPLWPAGVVGSITHTDSLAAAVVLPSSRYACVGIDIERIADGSAQQALLSVISQREIAQLCGLSDTLPMATLLTLVFSAKESLYKGMYATVQRFFDFDCAQLCRFNVLSGWLCLKLSVDLCPQLRRGSEHRVYFRLLQADLVMTSYCQQRASYRTDSAREKVSDATPCSTARSGPT